MPVDYVKQTLETGIPPLETEYRPVCTATSGEQVGIRTVLKLNTVELGALYPKQYRVVTNRNTQSSRLATACYRQVSRTMEAMIGTGRLRGFVSVYAPLRQLMRGDLEKLLAAEREADKLYLPHLCFEFSSDILLDDSSETAARLNALKEYGVRLMISEFGDEFCPVLRLKSLPFDYVVLDDSLSDVPRLRDENFSSVSALIESLGMSAILESTDSPELIEAASLAGCRYYCGAAPLPLREVTG